MAARLLQKEGLKILEKNFRCPLGEIDIVALDGDTVVFVEVKMRSSRMFGLPEESVTARKLSVIARVGDWYRLNHSELPLLSRIDVISIRSDTGEVKRIKNVTG